MGAINVSVAFFVACAGIGQSYSSFGAVRQKEIDQQNENFRKFWGEPLVWRFDDLPTKGYVPGYRVPYSGYIYPDRNGGTLRPLRKYDQAFDGNRNRASGHERWDIAVHRKVAPQTRRWGIGRFGGRTYGTHGTYIPHWYGHCNGWTAAAIRHSVPVNNVTKNGVVFTPGDIKGLLAELYIFSDTVFLGGLDYVVNPATFHVIVTNWIGRKAHPVAMEVTPGEEVWNYPFYTFNTSHTKRSAGRQVEVAMNIDFANSTQSESNSNIRRRARKYFHYTLDLNGDGEIIGGRFHGNSSRVDMLWLPLPPSQGGKEGNKRGNPYLDVNEVLALWRASADKDKITKWVNIAPHPADGSIASRPPAEESAEEHPLAGNKAPPAESPSGAEADGTADSPEIGSSGESG